MAIRGTVIGVGLASVLALNGCVTVVDVKKTPVAGGKMRYEVGLLGADFQGDSLLSLGGTSTPDEPAARLLKLFGFEKDRSPHETMLEATQKMQQFMALLNAMPGAQLDDGAIDVAAIRKHSDLFRSVLRGERTKRTSPKRVGPGRP